MRKILIRHLFRFIRSSTLFRGAALAGALLAVHCSKAPAEQLTPAPSTTPSPASPPAPASPPSSAAPATPGGARSADSALRWDDPGSWHRRPASSPMRVAEYSVPRAPGDASDGECTVITFGAGQGGSVDSNVQRWVHQFEPLTGEPAKTTLRAGGLPVTRVEVAGSYHPMTMPGAPGGAAAQSGSRLVGAIVEAPGGLWFFKLTGPDATVKAATTAFDAMVASIHAP